MNLRGALRSPAVWRGIASIVAAVFVLAIPELLVDLLGVLIAVAIVVIGVIELAGWWTSTPRHPTELLRALILILGTVFLLAVPSNDLDLVTLAVATIITFRALTMAFTAYRSWRTTGDLFWPLIRTVLSLGLVVAIVFIPGTIVHIVVIIVGGAWIVGGVVVLVHALSDDASQQPLMDAAMVIREKSMDPDERDAATLVIFEGMDSRKGFSNFVALMAFSTAIATLGVELDSTAVVIGAMLIAPLMGPIMALSAATLMQWPRKASQALTWVGGGVAIGVAFSFVVALVAPELIEITENTQVLSRTSPTLLDLMVALAAGGAGAFALSHPRVSNSLPGVAIAVALVPPLAVVGSSLQAGQWAFAGGAMLLFLTNLVGIIVAAGIVYVLSGYSPWSLVEEGGESIKRSLGLIGVSLLLVALPLAMIGNELLSETTRGKVVDDAVAEWLVDSPEVTPMRSTIRGREVTLVVTAPGEIPDPQDLADQLADDLGGPVELTVDVVPETTYEVSASPG